MSESETVIKKECVLCHRLIISNIYPTINGDMCSVCCSLSSNKLLQETDWQCFSCNYYNRKWINECQHSINLYGTRKTKRGDCLICKKELIYSDSRWSPYPFCNKEEDSRELQLAAAKWIENILKTKNENNISKENLANMNKILDSLNKITDKKECVKCHGLIISEAFPTINGEMCFNCAKESFPLAFSKDISEYNIKPFIYKNDTINFNMPPHDDINSPAHYKKGGIETLDFIKAKLSIEEFQGFLKANIIKYISRASLKDGVKDYKKAQFYLNKLVEILDVKKVFGD